MTRLQKSILFFVPARGDGTGGVKYNSFVINRLSKIARVQVVDVLPKVNSLATKLAPFLRRYAFEAWLLETVMAVNLAFKYAVYSGIILMDYEICRYTWILSYFRNILDRTSIIFIYHFDDRDTADLRSQLAIRKLRIRNSSHIITISKYSQNEVIKSGFPAEKITVARPGNRHVIQSSIEVPLCGEESNFLLCVANIIPHKGHEVLISAMQQCKNRGFKLIVVGNLEIDPSCASKLKQQILAAGLDKRVRLTGRIQEEELNYLYSKATGFVFPSFMEGYGMAIAEALIFGLPVITTTAGAIPELVSDGMQGFLVRPGDPADLARAIDRLLGDSHLRAQLASAALRRGKTLPSWDEAWQQIEKAIKAYD